MRRVMRSGVVGVGRVLRLCAHPEPARHVHCQGRVGGDRAGSASRSADRGAVVGIILRGR